MGSGLGAGVPRVVAGQVGLVLRVNLPLTAFLPQASEGLWDGGLELVLAGAGVGVRVCVQVGRRCALPGAASGRRRWRAPARQASVGEDCAISGGSRWGVIAGPFGPSHLVGVQARRHHGGGGEGAERRPALSQVSARPKEGGGSFGALVVPVGGEEARR